MLQLNLIKSNIQKKTDPKSHLLKKLHLTIATVEDFPKPRNQVNHSNSYNTAALGKPNPNALLLDANNEESQHPYWVVTYNESSGSRKTHSLKYYVNKDFFKMLVN